MHVFTGGAFVPYTPGDRPLPRVSTSFAWHGRARDHLAPAWVEAGHG